MALKVNTCDFADEAAAEHELDNSRRIVQGNPKHPGFSFVRTITDSFKISGPYGHHICLVYELMREPLWLFERRCKNGRFTLGLIKGYLRLLLMGLDYLHTECHIIHTGGFGTFCTITQQKMTNPVAIDIKLDNIMVGFEDPSVIEDFVRAQAYNPMHRKVLDGYSVYRSHNDFGLLRAKFVLPKIADFGLAQYGTKGLQRHPIQPDHYRAPEVILGAGWTYSADIWNLGVLVRLKST